MVAAHDYPGATVSLIDVEEAHERDVRFLDCRLPRSYAAGSIPGARYVDVRGLRSGPLAQLPAREELAERFAALELAKDDTIVPYADRFTFSLAGYIWWLLRYIGYTDVRVLHGGFEAWAIAHFPIVVPEPLIGAQSANAAIHPGQGAAQQPGIAVTNVDARWIRNHVDDENVQLIDARTAEEFAGGHIPHIGGTYNVSHDAVFDITKGKLHEPERLQRLLSLLDAGKGVVAYCRSGVRSGTLLWALAAVGFDYLRNYDGSLLDWENKQLPLSPSTTKHIS